MSAKNFGKKSLIGLSLLNVELEQSGYENDLFWHALNYRGASVENAEYAWQELKACADRLIAAERESCAILCEAAAVPYQSAGASVALECADKIRKRSNV